MTTATPPPPVGAGALLRSWREKRRLSQLELSTRVQVSTRHLSYVENGRSRPSPEMIMRLAEQLELPLRERNEVLLAGGYAPAYAQQRLDAPALALVADALRMVLDRHLPYPAVVLNRWWEMVDANAAVDALLDGVAAHLLEPPVNVLRLTLHPDGLAPRIVNLGQWRAHLLAQLRRRVELTDDAQLRALHAELSSYPGGADDPTPSPHQVVLPMVLRVGEHTLSMFTIAAALGTPADVTVDELVVESFYPADDATLRLLRAEQPPPPT
ncbi:helix-turn-helix transcriptional regulator [Mycobacterium yunnanensis]|uniref:helix-turn-helix transcriptional regulator n=1 Tax=Mycobacterium yunnanensis TaxID=368477 RepID=UPI0021F29B1E|nr:helix-turn-helix transcriptional regulator [Mycobacterium yunnanensis]